MKLLDILLGRSRPVKSKLENLFAISTAYLTLTVNVGLKPGGAAGICFQPNTATEFRETEEDLKQLVTIASKATHTEVSFTQDAFGFRWILLKDPQFEDLVATLHMVSLTLQERGFGEQILAGVFRFRRNDGPVYWIYNYKRGAFYPMVPSGERQRDNAEELRLRSLLEKELPLEKDLRLWYPLWGIPF